MHSKKDADEGDLSTPCVFYAIAVDDHANQDLTHAPVCSMVKDSEYG